MISVDQKGTAVSRFSLYVDHRRVILFPRNTGSKVTLAYVINCHSEKGDFVVT